MLRVCLRFDESGKRGEGIYREILRRVGPAENVDSWTVRNMCGFVRKTIVAITPRLIIELRCSNQVAVRSGKLPSQRHQENEGYLSSLPITVQPQTAPSFLCQFK
ncbi:hypothetical protein VNO77_26982 [Canavalia gladiata]|uniref:Uncharacterized protein n=1 Tax=Canavalia gladiata TaxID=3824 RepID=A0AAN9KT80_CANGL